MNIPRERYDKLGPYIETTDEAYESYMQYISTCAFVQTLKERGMDVDTKVELGSKDLEDLPQAQGRLFATWLYNFQGLEAGVVVFLPGDEAGEKLSGVTPGEELSGVKPGEELSGVIPEEELPGVKPGEELSGVKPGEKLPGVNPGEELPGVKPGELSGVKPGEKLPDVKPGEELSGVKPGEELPGVKPGEELSGVKPGEKLPDVKPGEELSGVKPREELPGVKSGEELPRPAAESRTSVTCREIPTPGLRAVRGREGMMKQSPEQASESPEPARTERGPEPSLAGVPQTSRGKAARAERPYIGQSELCWTRADIARFSPWDQTNLMVAGVCPCSFCWSLSHSLPKRLYR